MLTLSPENVAPAAKATLVTDGGPASGPADVANTRDQSASKGQQAFRSPRQDEDERPAQQLQQLQWKAEQERETDVVSSNGIGVRKRLRQ